MNQGWFDKKRIFILKCKHCGVAYHDKSVLTPVKSVLNGESIGLRYSQCPECLEYNVDFVMGDIEIIRSAPYRYGNLIGKASIDFTVHPRQISLRELPYEVPVHIRTDFREAASILELSPRASAALGRRLMEHILLEQGAPSSKNLYEQIEWAKHNGLPSYLSSQLDQIRKIGKFAAHAKRNSDTGEILDVSLDEAEGVLIAIELLCDFYYVLPATSAARQSQIDGKLAKTRK